MKTIKINDKEYNVKYSIRSMFIFEQIKGEPFGLITALDNFIFFYSMIIASNKDCTLKWDEFIDAIDEDPTIVTKMQEVLTAKENNAFPSGDTEEKKS